MCKKILQICLQAIFPWNIGEDEFWPSHSDSLPSTFKPGKIWSYYHIYCSMKFGICVHICPNFKSARAWQLQDCPFWIYIFDNCSQCLWCGVILSTRDMNDLCCRKLDSLKVALLGFYLDNRPRLPWREFIYSAHHVHGWQSQAASHRELDSITSANLGLHLISTTASDACEEKYFIYRVHHLRGVLS